MRSKVSIVKCRTYDTGQLKAAVNRAFELIGGLSGFIKRRERVLVKPNILSACLPEQGVNTHIEVVRSVVRLVKECGAVPFIGDNPGGSVSPKQAYEVSGIVSIAKEEGVEVKCVEGVKIVNKVPIASYFFDCDKIISLPKMKTHSLMGITGAVKNMYGAVSGLHKSEYHKKFPRVEDFARILVDVFEIVKPNLVLMDGIVAMDGDGPNVGNLKDVGLLMASADSVAMDSVFSHLIGVDPFSILSTKEAYERGLGEIKLENIEILGESIENARMKKFEMPRSNITSKLADFLPERISSYIAGLIQFRPYIKGRLCKKCLICAKSCPVSAITIEEKISKIDYGKCIRCMCCHEVCPYSSVILKRNLLARVFGL